MILHFIDTKHVGGIETHVETLVQAQIAKGHHAAVLLWQCHDNGRTLERYKKSGLRVLSACGSLKVLFRFLRSLKPEILHTHGYKAGIIGRVVAFSTRTPVISTFHAGERAPFPVNVYQIIDEWTSFLGGRIAVSQPIAAILPFRTPVIANFVDVPDIELHLKKSGQISYVGRMSPEKGPDLFGEIAKACNDKNSFVMFGEGPMAGAVKLRFGDFIKFNGFATDMNEVWNRTELLLMPSRNEGLPMAALEAMARGIPVAASRVGALPSIIDDGVNGFLFDVGDVRSAVLSVKKWRMMSVLEKENMAMAARVTVRMHYSGVTGLPKIMSAYDRAGRRRAGSIISMVQSSSGR